MSERRAAGSRDGKIARTSRATKPRGTAKSASPAKPASQSQRARRSGRAPSGKTADNQASNGSAAFISGETDGDWRALADQIAKHASDFLDALAALGRGEGGDEVVPLLLLEVAQVMLAGAQLGASQDVIPSGNAEPDVGADPDLDELRAGLAGRLSGCDEYAELFDPYRDAAPTSFRLSDDLAAVASDLIHGMRHYEAGRSAEALWWWQYSYVNQWGTHGGAALRALHAVVAHARLDVADEEIPG
jgi:hypothetical protein